MYRLSYQCLNKSEAFNSGELLIESHNCSSIEEARKDIKRILELWPYSGYWLEDLCGTVPGVVTGTVTTIIEHKPFDEEMFMRSYYGMF